MQMTSEIEHFGYGIERCYLNDGHIVLIKAVGEVARDALDTYAALLIESVNQFPDPDVTYIILNFSGATMSFTPYGRTKTMEILKSVSPHRKVYGATVYANSAFVTLITVFTNAALRAVSSRMTLRNFSTVEQAAVWLEVCRKKQQRKVEG